MFSFEHSTVINKPVSSVFTYVTNPATITAWRGPDLVAVNGFTAPLRAGSEFQEMIKFMGVKPYAMRVTELEANQREVIQCVSGPVARPTQTFTFEPSGSGTKITIHVDAQTGGFFLLMQPMMRSMFKKKWVGYFTTLKQTLEAS